MSVDQRDPGRVLTYLAFLAHVEIQPDIEPATYVVCQKRHRGESDAQILNHFWTLTVVQEQEVFCISPHFKPERL